MSDVLVYPYLPTEYVHLHDTVVCLISFSDVIVQIVDARNPLLFRCEDLVRMKLTFNVYFSENFARTHSIE